MTKEFAVKFKATDYRAEVVKLNIWGNNDSVPDEDKFVTVNKPITQGYFSDEYHAVGDIETAIQDLKVLFEKISQLEAELSDAKFDMRSLRLALQNWLNVNGKTAIHADGITIFVSTNSYEVEFLVTDSI